MVEMIALASRNVNKSLLIFAMLSVATLLGACDRTAEPISRQTMTALSPRLQPLFEKTRTVCFGRFVMEIPATATVVYGPAEVETPIEYFKGHGGRVAEHLNERLAEIEKEREFLLKDDLVTLPLFGKVIDGANPGQKIVFGSKNQIGYTIYSFVPVGKDLFIQHLNSVLPQHDRIATINKVAGQLKLRSESEIPPGSGTCIEGGFVPLDLKYERVTVGVRLKEFPDVHFSVDVHKNQERLAESGRLELMREQAKDDAEKRGHGSLFARIKILRKADRQVDAWKAIELLTRTPAHDEDTETHEFRLQSLGAVDDLLQPHLDVRLDSGVKNDRRASVKPSITDEEAIALWDKLTNTIKVRPPVGKQKTAAELPKTPLTTLIATGGICPQSGWWQCTEGDNIEGGRRKHFAAGTSMPHAILVATPNLWQKLVGNQSRHKVATVWQLVEYETGSVEHSLEVGGDTLPPSAVAERSGLPDHAVTKDAPPTIT